MTLLVGYFSIFLGLLWLIWPQLLRNWAAGKLSWILLCAVLFPFFFPLGHWAGTQWGLKGWLGVILVFAVLGAVVRSLIGKASQKLPLALFRAAGALNALSGAWLVWFKK